MSTTTEHIDAPRACVWIADSDTISESNCPTVALDGEHPPSGDADQPVRAETPFRVGQFEVESPLGVGGMAAVFQGRDPQGTPVAIKVPIVRGQHRDRWDEQLRQEARITTRVQNLAGIARLLGHGEARGLPYLAYEKIEGVSLLQAFDTLLSRRTRVGLVLSLARIVGAVHLREVVHCDIKPGNVLVDREGQPWLIDFGLALELGATPNVVPGRALGTPLYMAPEQFTEGEIGAQADVWALGLLLYLAITDTHPLSGTPASQLGVQVVGGSFDPPRLHDASIPVPLEAVCLRALARDPADRPKDGNAFAAELSTALTGEPA